MESLRSRKVRGQQERDDGRCRDGERRSQGLFIGVAVVAPKWKNELVLFRSLQWSKTHR